MAVIARAGEATGGATIEGATTVVAAPGRGAVPVAEVAWVAAVVVLPFLAVVIGTRPVMIAAVPFNRNAVSLTRTRAVKTRPDGH